MTASAATRPRWPNLAVHAGGGVLGGLVGGFVVVGITLLLKGGMELVARQDTWVLLAVPLGGLVLSGLVLEGIGLRETVSQSGQMPLSVALLRAAATTFAAGAGGCGGIFIPFLAVGDIAGRVFAPRSRDRKGPGAAGAAGGISGGYRLPFTATAMILGLGGPEARHADLRRHAGGRLRRGRRVRSCGREARGTLATAVGRVGMRFALLLGLLACAAPAGVVRAQSSPAAPTLPNERESGQQAHRHERLPNLYGAKAGYVSAWLPNEDGLSHLPQLQVSFFFERSLLHEWLEFELNVGFAWHPEEASVPVELVFKKPFHPTEALSPYLGVGPAMSILVEPHTRVFGQGTLVFGLYWFFREEHGLDLEVSYRLGLRDGEPAHELLVLVGPVTRIDF